MHDDSPCFQIKCLDEQMVRWKMDASSEVSKAAHNLADFSCSHLASLGYLQHRGDPNLILGLRPLEFASPPSPPPSAPRPLRLPPDLPPSFLVEGLPPVGSASLLSRRQQAGREEKRSEARLCGGSRRRHRPKLVVGHNPSSPAARSSSTAAVCRENGEHVRCSIFGSLRRCGREWALWVARLRHWLEKV
jgi:hypothetical protein